MITMLNRKELIATFQIKEQARVRNILQENNIDYLIKTVDRTSPAPMAAGLRGGVEELKREENSMLEYVIYVGKEDYQKARKCIE